MEDALLKTIQRHDWRQTGQIVSRLKEQLPFLDASPPHDGLAADQKQIRQWARSHGSFLITLAKLALDTLKSNIDAKGVELLIGLSAQGLSALQRLRSGLTLAPLSIEGMWYRLVQRCLEKKKFKEVVSYGEELLRSLQSSRGQPSQKQSAAVVSGFEPMEGDNLEFSVLAFATLHAIANSYLVALKGGKPSEVAEMMLRATTQMCAWVRKLYHLQPKQASCKHVQSAVQLLTKSASFLDALRPQHKAAASASATFKNVCNASLSTRQQTLSLLADTLDKTPNSVLSYLELATKTMTQAAKYQPGAGLTALCEEVFAVCEQNFVQNAVRSSKMVMGAWLCWVFCSCNVFRKDGSNERARELLKKKAAPYLPFLRTSLEQASLDDEKEQSIYASENKVTLSELIQVSLYLINDVLLDLEEWRQGKSLRKNTVRCLQVATRHIDTFLTQIDVSEEEEQAAVYHYSLLQETILLLAELQKFYSRRCSLSSASSARKTKQTLNMPPPLSIAIEKALLLTSDCVENGVSWETSRNGTSSPKSKSPSTTFSTTLRQYQVTCLETAAVVNYERAVSSGCSESIEANGYLEEALGLVRENAAIQSLLPWIISSFYNFGVHMYNASFYQDAMEPIRTACSLYEELIGDSDDEASPSSALQQQYISQLPNRYKLLSVCCYKSGLYADALQAMLNAVRWQLSGSNRGDGDAIVSSGFMDLLTQFVRMKQKLGYEETAENEELECLLPTLRTVSPALSKVEIIHLLEQELALYRQQPRATGHRDSVVDQLSVLDALLSICTEEEDAVRRAMLLLERAALTRASLQEPTESSAPNDAASQVSSSLCEEAVSLLEQQKTCEQGDETNKTLSDMLCIAWLHIGMNMREEIERNACSNNGISSATPDVGHALAKSHDYLSRALAQWLNVFGEQITNQSPEEWSQYFANTERSYLILTTLVDWFGFFEEVNLQIQALKLIILMNLYVRVEQPTAFDECIKAYAGIVKSYCRIGCTKEASLYLQRGRELVAKTQKGKPNQKKNSRCEFPELDLAECHLLIATEDLTTAEVLLADLQQPALSDATINRQAAQLVVECKQLISSIRFQQGRSAESLEEAHHAMRTAHGLLNAISRDIEKAATTTTDGNITTWQVLGSFLMSLYQLAELWRHRGGAQEALYYANKGWTAASQPKHGRSSGHSLNWTHTFLLGLVETSCTAHRLDDASDHLQKANGMLDHMNQQSEEILVQKHIIQQRIMEAAVATAKEDLDAALESYAAAEQLLDKAKLSEPTKLFPEDSDFSYLEGALHAVLPEQDSDMELEEEQVGGTGTVLQHLYAQTRHRQASLLTRKGKPEDAIQLLDDISSNNASAITRVDKAFIEYEYGRAYLCQLKKVNPEMAALWQRPPSVELPPSVQARKPKRIAKRTNPSGKRVAKRKNATTSTSSASSSSSSKPKATSKSANSKNILVADVLWDKAFHHFQQAHQLCFSAAGTPSILTRLVCKHLALLSSSLQKEERFQSLAHLDSSFGVTFVHRMQDRNLRLRRMANEEKANSEEVDVDVLSSMFSSLSTCEGGTEETEEEIRAMLCFLREDVHVLPDDWTVCSLSLFSSEQDDFSNGHQRKSSHLLLSRHQANRSPIVARIPLSTTNVEGEPMSTLQQHLKEFEDIMAESQKSTDASSLQLTTDSEKRGWWRRRKKLDQRMQHLLYSIEEEWLGHWKCLLLGSLRLQEDDGKCNKKAATLAERLASLFSEAAEEAISVALDEELFRVCFASIPELAEEQGVECLIHVLGWKPNRVNEASRAKLTKFWQEMNQEYIEVMPLVEEEELSDRNPVFLVLDKDLQHLPWECIPIMVNRAVARVPSIRFLAQHSNNKDRLFIDGIRPDNTRYLLNPSQDLPKTQKTFKPYFERQKGWRGITGEVPTEDQFREMLTESDLFIYCGHSTGERYLNAVHLQNLQRCAVTLLMGCSSGKLAPSGAFEPMGVVLNYLLCGCPAVVGNLWDVTDGDIDRFTMALLQGWLEDNPSRSLLDVIPMARRACKLRYLVGAAPVCYGLPAFLQQ